MRALLSDVYVSVIVLCSMMLRGHPCLFLKIVGLRIKIIGRNQS